MELKSQIHGTDISRYSTPFEIVFTLADQLLNQGYIISLDNYYSSPELFNLLNQFRTDAVGNTRFSRKGLPEDVINCKLKKGGVEVSYRNKLMVLKWKDKRDVCMLISLHDDEMGTIHDKKCRLKQKPKVCTDYNDAMGGVDISDHYL
jgi:hypothetical protein